MGEIPTSMSAAPPSPPVPKTGYATSVWIVALIVVAAAVLGAGFVAGYEYRGSPASHPAAVVNSTLSILGAGTLGPFFPQLASELASYTPGITAPTAAQTYEGSLDITTAITTGTATADVAAVADYRLIPQLLEPKFASWEVVFGATPEALVYNPTIPAFDGINTANWGTQLVTALTTPGVAPFGYWNASTDPNGYNEIFSMMLQGLIYSGGNVSAVYGHFYSGAPGAFATANPAITIHEHESDAATLIDTDVISSCITYRSFAIANAGPDLAYIPFNPIVGLSANNTTALADYAMLSTTILNAANAPVVVHPAPVLFSITVPSNAPNPTLGAAFIQLVLSPMGQAVLGAGGAFTPIYPGWSDNPSAVPPALAPFVTALPPWAAHILG